MGPACLPPPHRQGTCVPTPLLLTSGGLDWRPVQTYSPKDLQLPPFRPPVLTSNGEHQNTGKRVVRILLECCFVHHKSKTCTHLQTNDSSNLTATSEDILVHYASKSD